MEAKEVESRGRALAKAYAQNDAAQTLLELLDELRRQVRATEELLRSTRIGVIVNKVKQHKDAAVARQASELVSKWRSDVRKAGAHDQQQQHHQSRGGAGGLASPTAATAPATAMTTAAAAGSSSSSVAPAQRSAKADGVNTSVTGSAVRDNCLRLMYDGLALMSEETPEQVLTVARQVEQEAWTAYPPAGGDTYKAKMRSLYQNLKNKSNPQLRRRLLSGDVAPARFVVMTHDELKSAERREEDARMERENFNKAMVPQEPKVVSSSLKCGKCGGREVSYSQAQTRSADEPLTTFCACQNCGKRWKFS